MKSGNAIKTAAKAVILRHNQILVLEKKGADGPFFVLPGGKQQHGESLPDAVRRECKEELDIDVDVGELLAIRDYIGRNHEFSETHKNLHKVEFFFKCTLMPGSKPGRGVEPDRTQIGFRWLPVESLPEVKFFPLQLRTLLSRPHELTGSLYCGDVN